MTVKEISFSYGDSFDESIYPEIPKKDGYYIRWDKSAEKLKNLKSDTSVRAVYEPYITTLASDEEENGCPLFLVQGEFHSDDTIMLEAAETSDSYGSEVLACVKLQIPEDNVETHIVRWRIPEAEKREILVYTDNGNGFEKTETEINGSYLCFSMSGSGKILITAKREKSSVIRIGIPLLFFAAAGSLLITGKKKNRRKNR